MFFLQLFPGVLHHVPGLHGKAAEELAFPAVVPQVLEDVLGAFQGDAQIVVGFLHLVLGHLDRGVVRHRRRLDDDVLLRGPGGDFPEHILR